MERMGKIGKVKKKGLSNVVGYVLLISITISLSVLVYGWLKFYVETPDTPECPSNVNVIIESYECHPGANGNLTVYLKNKGFFDIDGFVLRVHNRPDAEFGFYVFDDVGVSLSPGEVYNKTYNISKYGMEGKQGITLIDVQPFVNENGAVACKSYSSQRVSGCLS